MQKNIEYFAKTMKVIYCAVFILALFVISNGKEQLSLLEQNPVVSQLNKTIDNNYKIVRANDVTTNVEMEQGLISQDYIVRVNEEKNKEEYVQISNEIISSVKSNYSDSIGKITINFVKKKGDILLYNIIYSPNN